MLEQFEPLRAGEGHRPDRRALIDFHNQHAADARPFHRLQVGGDALAGDVAVQPEPIDPGFGGIGGRPKIGFPRRGVFGGMAEPIRASTAKIEMVIQMTARNRRLRAWIMIGMSPKLEVAVFPVSKQSSQLSSGRLRYQEKYFDGNGGHVENLPRLGNQG